MPAPARSLRSRLLDLPRRWALQAIAFYQRHLSPRKGFACAYRVHTGRRSCSALGFRAIRQHGLFTGLRILDTRLAMCGETHRAHRSADRPVQAWRRPAAAQRGDCDCNIGSCDGPGNCDSPCDLGDVCNCLDCADCFDCDRRKRKGTLERRDGRKRGAPPRSGRTDRSDYTDRYTSRP